MRKSLLLLPLVAAAALSACVPAGNGYNSGYGGNAPLNSAAVRTIGGAAVGAVVADATGGSKTRGALIGAVAGGGSCVVPGANNCY